MASKACCFHFFYWIVLLLTIIIALVAIILPTWVTNDNNVSTFAPTVDSGDIGPVTACVRTAAGQESCGRWGDAPDDIPGTYFRATAGVFIFAIIVMILSLIFTTLTFCCCFGAQKPQAGLIIVGAIGLVVAMFLFGAGLEATVAGGETDQRIGVNCGPKADGFDRDECELGAGAGMAVAAAVLTMLTGIMACFVKVGNDTMA